ncbi:uncharacterized protein LOC109727970 [Ananas comosus]|uniref:Uncharacterized protein LOC109727970 n=1 Tax=Ananas comosus TaxID=4615 RepID=A0A6P5HD40_ANACO|nr:uncharacterized protein LOC109727970 [Ananas comosus]
MAYMEIFTFSFMWLTLVSCSPVRGRLVMESYDALEAKAQKTVYGSEIEVHALNSSNRVERVIPSQLAPRSNESLRTKIPSSINIYAPEDDSDRIEHWAVYQSGTGTSKAYYGAKATLVVYGFPNLEVGQISSAGIWVANGADGPRNQLNVIQAGWQVFPELYGDSNTHFFTSWTADGYNSTGCYNLQCNGFVLTNTSGLAPGVLLRPVTTPGGTQYEISIRIFKDPTTGNWWLQYGHGDNLTPVGYWPKSLFTSLADEATRVDFGGEVSFQKKNGVSPPMGSGYFPTDHSKTAYIKDTAYVDKDGNYFIPKNPASYADNPYCYKLAGYDPLRFAYGGPGGCNNN